MGTKVYKRIAELLIAIQNCENGGDEFGFKAQHKAELRSIVSKALPSGSGFDNGTVLVPDSEPNRLVFRTSFHHMDVHGFYDGWTEHDVIVTPHLLFDISIRITGRNRNDIKEFIDQTFRTALEALV